MSLINVAKLTFSYEGSTDNIFEDTSFQIDTNWKLGLIGRNGRGKTTFLNLLQKKYEYSGTIAHDVNFEYFPYVVEDKNCLTIDVIKEIYPDYLQWELIKELNTLEVSDEILYQEFSTLSNGEQTKVLLAVLFLKENSFLLIDEPTNHLDKIGREVVSNYLNTKKGFILVSHDRTFLDNCIDHVLSINKNNIEIQKGNFSSWWRNKMLIDEFEMKKNTKLRKEIERLEASSEEKRAWSNAAESRKIGFDPRKVEKNINRRVQEGAKSKKAMKRSKSIYERQQSVIEEKSKLLKNIENTDELKISPILYHTDKLIELENVSILYGAKTVCGDVSFSINSGERIALQGKNGSGKSSIIKLIIKNGVEFKGVFRKGSQLKISYVPQDTSILKGSIKDYASKLEIDESLFKAILRKLDFSREQFEKDMISYSAGQKKKVLIAASLCEKAHLYIWDEPLNYIDVYSRIQIENLIMQYKPTMLLIEHDASFCDKVCNNFILI